MQKIPLRVVRSRTALIDAIRNERSSGHSIGFVPTMGALHNGHLSLISLSREKTDRTVASIFVNPTQFAPGEDFDSYPRREDDDLAKLDAAGCHIAYLPRLEDMYPDGNVTNVRVEGLSDLLDGRFRPHFFYGVATVVARLLIQVTPDVAVFGEKDFQQLQIIKRMVKDLSLPVEILGGQTRRDSDGLAQSSRNEYLSPDARRLAGVLQAALQRAKTRIRLGTTISTALEEATASLEAAGFNPIDYVSAVRSDDLTDLPDGAPLSGDCRLLGAAWLDGTRLIDNIALN